MRRAACLLLLGSLLLPGSVQAKPLRHSFTAGDWKGAGATEDGGFLYCYVSRVDGRNVLSVQRSAADGLVLGLQIGGLAREATPEQPEIRLEAGERKASFAFRRDAGTPGLFVLRLEADDWIVALRTAQRLVASFTDAQGRPRSVTFGLGGSARAFVALDECSLRAGFPPDTPGADTALALRLLEGEAVPRDPARAAELLKRAAEKGDAEGAYNLGVLLERGLGVAADVAAAARWYQKAVEAGHARAPRALGLLREQGRGVAADPAAAVALYRLGDRRGDPDAAFQLATMLEAGRGTAEDVEAARAAYERAAETGHAEAARRRGLLRLQPEKRTWPYDPVEARGWLERAVALGSLPAHLNLARLHATGQGVPAPSHARAQELAQAAADRGHAPAMIWLAEDAMTRGLDAAGDAAAVSWLRRAREAGGGYAAFALGFLTFHGRGTAADPAAAAALYRDAAAAGWTPAMTNLALLLERGVAGPADPVAARGWLDKAAAAGQREAQYHLARQLIDGIGGPPDPARALSWLADAAEQGHAEAARRGLALAGQLRPDAPRLSAERFLATARRLGVAPPAAPPRDAAGEEAAARALGEALVAASGGAADWLLETDLIEAWRAGDVAIAFRRAPRQRAQLRLLDPAPAPRPARDPQREGRILEGWLAYSLGLHHAAVRIWGAAELGEAAGLTPRQASDIADAIGLSSLAETDPLLAHGELAALLGRLPSGMRGAAPPAQRLAAARDLVQLQPVVALLAGGGDVPVELAQQRRLQASVEDLLVTLPVAAEGTAPLLERLIASGRIDLAGRVLHQLEVALGDDPGPRQAEVLGLLMRTWPVLGEPGRAARARAASDALLAQARRRGLPRPAALRLAADGAFAAGFTDDGDVAAALRHLEDPRDRRLVRLEVATDLVQALPMGARPDAIRRAVESALDDAVTTCAAAPVDVAALRDLIAAVARQAGLPDRDALAARLTESAERVAVCAGPAAAPQDVSAAPASADATEPGPSLPEQVAAWHAAARTQPDAAFAAQTEAIGDLARRCAPSPDCRAALAAALADVITARPERGWAAASRVGPGDLDEAARQGVIAALATALRPAALLSRGGLVVSFLHQLRADGREGDFEILYDAALARLANRPDPIRVLGPVRAAPPADPLDAALFGLALELGRDTDAAALLRAGLRREQADGFALAALAAGRPLTALRLADIGAIGRPTLRAVLLGLHDRLSGGTALDRTTADELEDLVRSLVGWQMVAIPDCGGPGRLEEDPAVLSRIERLIARDDLGPAGQALVRCLEGSPEPTPVRYRALRLLAAVRLLEGATAAAAQAIDALLPALPSLPPGEARATLMLASLVRQRAGDRAAARDMLGDWDGRVAGLLEPAHPLRVLTRERQARLAGEPLAVAADPLGFQALPEPAAGGRPAPAAAAGPEPDPRVAGGQRLLASIEAGPAPRFGEWLRFAEGALASGGAPLLALGELALDKATAEIRAREGPGAPWMVQAALAGGQLALARGDLEAAEARITQGLALAEAIYGPWSVEVAQALVGLAQVQVAGGAETEGEETLRRAVAIAERHDAAAIPAPWDEADPRGTARGRFADEREPLQALRLKASLALALLRLDDDRPAEALESLAAADAANRARRRLFDDDDDDRRLADARIRIAAVTGGLAGSTTALLDAYRSAVATGAEQAALVAPLRRLARLQRQVGRADAAMLLAARAARLATEAHGGGHPVTVAALADRADAARAAGDRTQALALFDRMAAARGDERAIELPDGEPPTRAAAHARRAAILDHAALVGAAADDAATDRIARLLQELPDPRATQPIRRAGLRPAGDGRLATLLARHRDLSRAADASDAAAAAAARREATALVDEIGRAFPGFAAAAWPVPLDLREIRALLGDAEAVLLFGLGADGGQVVAVTREAAVVRPVTAGLAALTSHIASLRAAIDPHAADSVGGDAFPLDVAATLYDALIRPVEPVIAGKRELILVPDGPLHSLPPSLLVTAPPAEARVPASRLGRVPWLVRRWAVSSVPSLAVLRSLRVRAMTSPADDRAPLLAVGDPVLADVPLAVGDGVERPGARAPAGPGFYRRGGRGDPARLRTLASLPETEPMLEGLAGALGQPADALLLRWRATEPALRGRDDLAGQRILAIAAPALVAGSVVGRVEPALVLTPPDTASDADDGLLSASELAGLTLAADWVILPAVTTVTAGGAPAAEGLPVLARALLHAGADALLVSHWVAAPAAASRLMGGMLTELARTPGLSRAEAQRRAMLTAMADPTDLLAAHPARWAVFTIIGDGGRPR